MNRILIVARECVDFIMDANNALGEDVATYVQLFDNEVAQFAR